MLLKSAVDSRGLVDPPSYLTRSRSLYARSLYAWMSSLRVGWSGPYDVDILTGSQNGTLSQVR
jgi:hypothetical protein